MEPVILTSPSQLRAILAEVLGDIRPSWMTSKEAAARLKVTKKTLAKYRDEGLVTHSRFKGLVYYLESDIDNLFINNIVTHTGDAPAEL